MRLGFHLFLSPSFGSPFFIVLPLHTPFLSSFLSRLPVFIFTMRWDSSVVPVHLVPFHRNRAHFCPVLSSLHVFIFLSLLRAHVHIRPNLSLSRLPSGRRVCVTLAVFLLSWWFMYAMYVVLLLTATTFRVLSFT